MCRFLFYRYVLKLDMCFALDMLAVASTICRYATRIIHDTTFSSDI